MKYDSRFTTGNIITIIMILGAAAVTILQAIEHRKDENVHQRSSDVVRRDEFRELRFEMKEGFQALHDQEQKHFDSMTKRIDGLYQ